MYLMHKTRLHLGIMSCLVVVSAAVHTQGAGDTATIIPSCEVGVSYTLVSCQLALAPLEQWHQRPEP